MLIQEKKKKKTVRVVCDSLNSRVQLQNTRKKKRERPGAHERKKKKAFGFEFCFARDGW